MHRLSLINGLHFDLRQVLIDQFVHDPDVFDEAVTVDGHMAAQVALERRLLRGR